MEDFFQNISLDYDNQITRSNKLSYEANLAIKPLERKIANEIYFDFFKISNSINQVKTRIFNRY